MFSAYARVGANRYREIFGLDFEQFEVGQKFVHHPGLTVSQQDNRDECAVTLNCAHIHYNEDYASKAEFKLPVYVSTSTLQILFGLAWKTYARKDRLIECEEISMTAPVFGGDTLYAESEVLEKLGYTESLGKIKIELSGRNQINEIICRTVCWITIFREGNHPYYRLLEVEPVETSPKFSGYRLDDEGRLVEQLGLFYEDFELGEIYEHMPRKLISAEEARNQALQNFNWDPRYIDRNYAETYFNEQACPVPELTAMGMITAATTRTLGRVVVNLGWSNFKVTRYLYPNELVSVTTEIMDKRNSKSRPDQGILTVRTRCFDNENKEIAHYDRKLLVYREGCIPS